MLIKIIIEPSFDEPTKIEINDIEDAIQLKKYRIIDDEETENIEECETEEILKLSISKAEYDALLHDIINSKFSIPKDDTIGLDGTFFTVIFENGFNKAVYSWWVEPPEYWKELNIFIDKVEILIGKKV